MHKLLLRQVRRVLGVEEDQLPAVLAELTVLAQREGVSESAGRLLGGLQNFLTAWKRHIRKVTATWNSRRAACSSVRLNCLTPTTACATNWTAAPVPLIHCAKPPAV
jgi:hypothetical protein